MAKKDKDLPTNDELAKVEPVPSAAELVPFSELIKSLTRGADVEVELVITGGDGVYWPPSEGAWIHGVILNRFEITTQFGPTAFYSVKLAKPCDAINRDGELFQAQPGDSIMVLERTVLRHLKEHIGKEVVIQCRGKAENKEGTFSYYNFEAGIIKNRMPAGTGPSA